jgi:hypothetical protein
MKQRDTPHLLPCPPSPANAVHIVLDGVGHVIVDDTPDVLHICRTRQAFRALVGCMLVG